jgi:hypothetical protein
MQCWSTILKLPCFVSLSAAVFPDEFAQINLLLKLAPASMPNNHLDERFQLATAFNGLVPLQNLLMHLSWRRRPLRVRYSLYAGQVAANSDKWSSMQLPSPPQLSLLGWRMDAWFLPRISTMKQLPLDDNGYENRTCAFEEINTKAKSGQNQRSQEVGEATHPTFLTVHLPSRKSCIINALDSL